MVFSGNDVLTGVNMLYVGFVLLVIVKNMEGKVGAKETAYMSILVGLLNFVTALYLGFSDKQNYLGLGAFLLFAFTYFFMALNILGGADTFTGLGWYAFGVTITCIPFAILYWQIDTVQAIIWIVWGQLWCLFGISNALKKNITKLVIADTYVVCVINIVVAIVYHMFGKSIFGI